MDLPARESIETRFIAQLKGAMGKQRQLSIATNFTAGFDQFQFDLEDIISANAQRLFQAQAEFVTQEAAKASDQIRQGLAGTGSAQVFGAAAGVDWARRRSIDMAQEIVDHTVERLAAAEAEGPERIAEVADSVFSDARAEKIGITETTAAISAAGSEVVQRIAEDPLVSVDYKELWITELDERVCPICAPLHGVHRGIWGKKFPTGPPAHVHCRCEIGYRFTAK